MPHLFFLVRGGHNWALWRGNAADAYLAAAGGSGVRRVVAAPVVLLVAAAATGWLYVVRPALPGPRIGEALPLDELAPFVGVAHDLCAVGP